MDSLDFSPENCKTCFELDQIFKNGGCFFFPNYPPKTAKYLLIFLFIIRKKKLFGLWNFEKNGFFGFLDFWIFGLSFKIKTI
jgi:hypothetical protein